MPSLADWAALGEALASSSALPLPAALASEPSMRLKGAVAQCRAATAAGERQQQPIVGRHAAEVRGQPPLPDGVASALVEVHLYSTQYGESDVAFSVIQIQVTKH